MATLKTWLASAALVGGAGGGAAAGLAATGEPTQAASSAPPATAAPDAGQLQEQIDALLQEDHALKHAVSRARSRLTAQVHAGERSLAVLHQRIVAAQAELNSAQAASARISTVTVGAPAATTATTHATTGASGAGSHGGDDSGEHEGGHDD
jgi:hypothetical protein